MGWSCISTCFFPGITSPIGCLNGLWRGMSKILSGVPLYGSGGGGGDGSPSLRHNQFVGVVGGDILNGEHLDNLFGALAGDGSSGGKAEGGGLRISATLFFHEHGICLQSIVMREERENNKRSDKAIPTATNGDDPSRICPHARWRGWLDRGCHMLLPRRTISADGRHVRNVLRLSDASDYFSDDLCPLPGALASLQILQTSPPHKLSAGHDKDNDG